MKIRLNIPCIHSLRPLKPTARICSMISVLSVLSVHAMILMLMLLASSSQQSIAQDTPGLFVEGYAWPISAKSGEAVSLHVSTSASQFQFEIYRLGSESKPVKLMGSDKSSLYIGPGHKHAIPEKASAEGCGWPSDVKITIPPDWQSGYYEVRFTAQDSGGTYTNRGRRTAQSSCFFVVRPANPGTETKILLQLSTNTYNAYNNWGGFSLYAYNGKANNQGHKVSFLRPPSSQFGSWEHSFVSWAEEARRREEEERQRQAAAARRQAATGRLRARGARRQPRMAGRTSAAEPPWPAPATALIRLAPVPGPGGAVAPGFPTSPAGCQHLPLRRPPKRQSTSFAWL